MALLVVLVAELVSAPLSFCCCIRSSFCSKRVIQEVTSLMDLHLDRNLLACLLLMELLWQLCPSVFEDRPFSSCSIGAAVAETFSWCQR